MAYATKVVHMANKVFVDAISTVVTFLVPYILVDFMGLHFVLLSLSEALLAREAALHILLVLHRHFGDDLLSSLNFFENLSLHGVNLRLYKLRMRLLLLLA